MNNKNLFGIIFTSVVSIAFIVAIFAWINLYKVPEISIKQIKKNELATYLNLKKIADAQNKYIQEDWDKDNELEYSKFLVHLWKTVISKNGETKLLNFITKKIGFATESSTALDGYTFMMLYYKTAPDKPIGHIDYTKEWALFASPLSRNQTGKLNFIIDQSGNVLFSESQTIYNYDLPDKALENGWGLLKSLDDLKEKQDQIKYIILE